jgi:uncharacterized membrane protein
MEILRTILGAICHQEAARSFAWGAWTAPLCHRCTGVYAGFVAGAVFAASSWRRPRGFGGWPLVAWHVLAFAQMALFGFHLVPHGVGVRFASGLVFGAALAYFTAPVFWAAVLAKGTRSWGRRDLAAYAAFTLALAALGLAAQWWVAGPAVAALAAVAVIGAFGAYALVNVAFVFWIVGSGLRRRYAAAGLVAGVALATLEMGGLWVLRHGGPW